MAEPCAMPSGADRRDIVLHADPMVFDGRAAAAGHALLYAPSRRSDSTLGRSSPNCGCAGPAREQFQQKAAKESVRDCGRTERLKADKRRKEGVIRPSISQAAAGMRQHGVDLAGVRGQVGLRHDVVAVVAGDILEQPLEILAVAVDGGLELAVGLILAADLVEGLLALQRVEPAGEDVPLAAPVTAPELDRGVMVDGAGDVDRQRVQRFHHMQGRALRGRRRARRRLRRTHLDLVARGVRQSR